MLDVCHGRKIFAFPSRTETFGQVVLEAMASGLPVVGLVAEGVCDLVENECTGLLVADSHIQEDEQIISYRKVMDAARPLVAA